MEVAIWPQPAAKLDPGILGDGDSIVSLPNCAWDRFVALKRTLSSAPRPMKGAPRTAPFFFSRPRSDCRVRGALAASARRWPRASP